MTLIYIITNLITGLSYIGKTGKTLDDRWQRHVADARRGVATYLYNAIRKYGELSFVREIVCECPDEDGNMWESFCISAFNTRSPQGYNMTDGGDGVPGYVFTEADRKKLGSGLRGKKRPPFSEEWKKKISESGKGKIAWNLGKPWSEATLEKIKAVGKANSANPNWRKSISKSVKRAWATPEMKTKMASVMAERSANGWAEKMAIRSANPEWIVKQKEGAKRRSQSPEWKANHAAMCADPAYRDKLSKAQRLRRDRQKFERLLLNAPIQYVQPL